MRHPLDSRKLLYFVVTVEMGSITRAADKLRIAQPALSQAIVGLEQTVGVALLIRASTGVTPTEHGKILYRHAQGVLRQLELAVDELVQKPGQIEGQVIVGMPSSVTNLLALRILRRARAETPGIRLRFLTAPSQFVNEQLFKSSYDLGVVTSEGVLRGLKVTPIVEEAITLVLPPDPDTPLLGEVCLSDVVHHSLVMPPSPNNVRLLFDNAIAEAGLSASIVAECDALVAVREFVAQGFGHSVMTWASMHPHGARERMPVRAIVDPVLARTLYVANSELRPMSQAAEVVRTMIMREAHDLIASGGWPTARSLAG